ncbi:hypothetical protein ACIRQO_15655, partial [Streptomyces anulatus]
PASAFVRAVKGIIDIVTFIVTQGAQIADFVNAVLDAVIAIANGGQAGVPKLIETALATSVPLLIGFLAALLGIGGLANKVKSVFQSVSRPVTRAIDKIVDFIAKAGKKLLKKSRKNEEGSQDQNTKKDPKIREKVTAEVNSSIPDDTPAQAVEAKLNSIFAKYRGKGLDMLAAKPSQSQPGRFEISMAASPVTVIRAAKVDPGTPALRDFINGIRYPEATFDIPKDVWLSGKAKMEDSGKNVGYGDTFAIGSLHTPTRVTAFDKVGSGEGLHAEEVLCEDLRSNWDNYVGDRKTEIEPQQANPRAQLVLKTTRSPCGRCAPQIGALRSFAKEKDWDLGIEVLSIGLYHGKVIDPATGKTITGTGAKGQEVKTGPAVGVEGLKILKEWGIDVVELTIADPTIKAELQKLGPKDRVKVANAIAGWNTKLRNELNELKNVKVTLKEI